MNSDDLKAGIAMRQALLAHAARAGGDLAPREAEFFEAGYAAGAGSSARAMAEVMMATAQCLMSELSAGEDDDDVKNLTARGVGWLHSELLRHLQAPTATACGCVACLGPLASASRMVLCPTCGNKRCPRANAHWNACSGSNEPGQAGSTYPAAAPATSKLKG